MKSRASEYQNPNGSIQTSLINSALKEAAAFLNLECNCRTKQWSHPINFKARYRVR
jgi:hypothetical protein